MTNTSLLLNKHIDCICAQLSIHWNWSDSTLFLCEARIGD